MLKKKFFTLFLTFSLNGCGNIQPRWYSDIKFQFETSIDNLTIENFIDCQKIWQQEFPYHFYNEIGLGAGNVRVTVVNNIREYYGKEKKYIPAAMTMSEEESLGDTMDGILNTGAIYIQKRDEKKVSEKEYKSIICHEMGHLIGLEEHSKNKNDIMFESINSKQIWNTNFKNDLKRVKDLYSN